MTAGWSQPRWEVFPNQPSCTFPKHFLTLSPCLCCEQRWCCREPGVVPSRCLGPQLCHAAGSLLPPPRPTHHLSVPLGKCSQQLENPALCAAGATPRAAGPRGRKEPPGEHSPAAAHAAVRHLGEPCPSPQQAGGGLWGELGTRRPGCPALPSGWLGNRSPVKEPLRNSRALSQTHCRLSALASTQHSPLLQV